MAEKPEKYRNIYVRQETHGKLKAHANKNGMKLGVVADKAITEYLESQKQTK